MLCPFVVANVTATATATATATNFDDDAGNYDKRWINM